LVSRVRVNSASLRSANRIDLKITPITGGYFLFIKIAYMLGSITYLGYGIINNNYA
jgi:hypothetical protein